MPHLDEASNLARSIAEADEATRAQIFDRLRSSKQLSRTVHCLNKLLERPELQDLGRKALRGLWLEHGG